MTVILVLLTFIAFLLIDHFFSKPVTVSSVSAPARGEARPPVPSLVGGFRLPENISYHPGHTWALAESPTLVRVGMDDFAGKLLGKVDSVELPARGTWVRQGQKFAKVTRGGKTVQLVSPVEGSVTDVNPEPIGKDVYGDGWLVSVQAPDKATCFRNLLSGKVAKWWMEEAASRFSPAFAQDGGQAVDDFATAHGRDWEAGRQGVPAQLKKVSANRQRLQGRHGRVPVRPRAAHGGAVPLRAMLH